MLGYGYNLGGTGKKEKTVSDRKWLFPATAGFLYFSHNEALVPMAKTDFLYGFTESFYAGVSLLYTSNNIGLVVPVLSTAFTKDPEKTIHNVSFIMFPGPIGIFSYSISLNRYMAGLILMPNHDGLISGLHFGYCF